MFNSMNKRVMLLLTITLVSILSLSGCSSSNPEPSSMTNTTGVGQFCISSPTKFSTILSEASLSFNTNYVFDGEVCDDVAIPFSSRRCFSSFEELDFYIQNNTNYAIKLNNLADTGISIYELTINDAINYFNSKGSSKKIIYYDDNIKLENNSRLKLKNMSELKKYISQTTPLYFAKLHDDREKVIYTLRYKQINKKLGDIDIIVLNLKKAKELTTNMTGLKNNNKIIINKINIAIKGVQNYEK